MPKTLLYDSYTILAAGATKSFDVADQIDCYYIVPDSGAVALVGSMIFNSTGTAEVSDTFVFYYTGGVTSVSPIVVSFFGVSLTDAQALYPHVITARYNGATWDVFIVSVDNNASTDINGGDLVNASVTNAKLAGSITLAKLIVAAARGYMMRAGVNGVWEATAASGNTSVVGGDGTDVGPQVVGGDLLKAGATWTIANNVVTTAKIDDAAVTVAKVETALKTELITVVCSFETNEVGSITFAVPFACSFTSVRAVAIKTIAATDAGTVVLKDNALTVMTLTTPISFAASDALGTAYSTAITANNTFTAGQNCTLTTAKATVGGRVLLSITALRA